jgi:hypothetical protein
MRYRPFLVALTALAVVLSLVAADLSPDLERIETLRVFSSQSPAKSNIAQAVRHKPVLEA